MPWEPFQASSHTPYPYGAGNSNLGNGKGSEIPSNPAPSVQEVTGRILGVTPLGMAGMLQLQRELFNEEEEEETFLPSRQHRRLQARLAASQARDLGVLFTGAACRTHSRAVAGCSRAQGEGHPLLGAPLEWILWECFARGSL